MVLPMDGFFDEHNLERLRAADTLLLGATTYMGLKSFWPAVAEDPGASPAVADHPEVADLHREIGQRNNQIRKVVVSDSLTDDETAPWTETPWSVAAPGLRRRAGPAAAAGRQPPPRRLRQRAAALPGDPDTGR
jgi:hypothetical protein